MSAGLQSNEQKIMLQRLQNPWTGPACLNVGSYDRSNQPKQQIKNAKSKTTARLIHVIF